MLILTSKEPTSYVLPVIDKKTGYKFYRYYDCEVTLYKAYRQLKAIDGKFLVLTPIIYV